GADPGPGRPRHSILATPADPVTMEEAVAGADALIRRGRPAATVTTNLELIMHAQRDRALARALAQADSGVADCIGVVWAARLLGHPVPERVPGVDLAGGLMALAAARS